MSAKLLFFPLCLILVYGSLSAQDTDTTWILRSSLISSETRKPFSSELDTSYQTILFYNPVFYHNLSNTFTGNAGNASISNFFPDQIHPHPFFFASPFISYLHTPYNTFHFNTKKPFTELKYISSGSRDNSEQILSALHTQNASQYTNIGLFYDLIASKGVYIDQNTGFNRLSLFGSYNKDQYSMYASANFNSLKAQENGGLSSMEAFLNQTGSVVNFDMALDDANSKFKYYSFFITQKISTPGISKDSLKIRQKQVFALQHSVNYNRGLKIYKDRIPVSVSPSFYRNNYYLIDQTYDSAAYHNIENRIDLNMSFAQGTQEMNAYLRHEFKAFRFLAPTPSSYLLNEQQIDTVVAELNKSNYNDISAGGYYRGILGNWDYKASGEVYLTGYRLGDINLNGVFTRYFSNKTRSISLTGEIASQKPDFFLVSYASGHFDWRKDLLNTDRIVAGMSYQGKDHFKTDFSLNYLTGLIYFDSLAIPAQFSDQLLVVCVAADKQFNWGPVHHRHRILLQQSTSDIVRIPQLSYGNTTWYEHYLFKKALHIMVGFRFYYHSRFKTLGWMPATGVFYNQDERYYGNYPYLDGFFNAKIKRTRFTIQYTNSLSGIAGYNYFLAHRYPAFGSSLKFGLAWTFYD